jgi:hypothetical protein
MKKLLFLAVAVATGVWVKARFWNNQDHQDSQAHMAADVLRRAHQDDHPVVS